jgi:hypothetical protein
LIWPFFASTAVSVRPVRERGHHVGVGDGSLLNCAGCCSASRREGLALTLTANLTLLCDALLWLLPRPAGNKQAHFYAPCPIGRQEVGSAGWSTMLCIRRRQSCWTGCRILMHWPGGRGCVHSWHRGTRANHEGKRRPQLPWALCSLPVSYRPASRAATSHTCSRVFRRCVRLRAIQSPK